MNGPTLPPELWAFVDRRRRLFGPDARCQRCGTSDPVVLVLGSRRLLCRRCELFRRTGRTTELHHVGGRPSTLVVEVDANIHAWLSLYQEGWRGQQVPGSSQAVLHDLLVLAHVLFTGQGRVEAA